MFKFLNIKKILVGALLIVLLVSVILMALTSYWMSNSKDFVYDTAVADKVKTKGDTALQFWADTKMYQLTPTVLNVMGILLVVTLVYVA